MICRPARQCNIFPKDAGETAAAGRRAGDLIILDRSGRISFAWRPSAEKKPVHS
jgi:hypothetical protein